MLQELLYKTSIKSVKGKTDIEVKSLHIDSRAVVPGGCFIAIKGEAADGHLYIDSAVSNGAVAIVCEVLPSSMIDNVTYLQVENSAIAAGNMSHRFYGEPTTHFKLVGVTGTNGKTTIATLLFNLFTGLGYKCGLVSTVQNQIGDQVIPATHTTPGCHSIK